MPFKYRSGDGSTTKPFSLSESLAIETSSVRNNAALSRGDIGEGAEAAVTALTEALIDEDAYVREAAATALDRIAPGTVKKTKDAAKEG